MAAITLLIGMSQAGKRDFPAFDPAHAHCAMETTYIDQACSDIFDKFYSTISSFTPEPRSKGYYRIKETNENDYIWATRETPTNHYFDDVIFVFVDQHI